LLVRRQVDPSRADRPDPTQQVKNVLQRLGNCHPAAAAADMYMEHRGAAISSIANIVHQLTASIFTLNMADTSSASLQWLGLLFYDSCSPGIKFHVYSEVLAVMEI